MIVKILIGIAILAILYISFRMMETRRQQRWFTFPAAHSDEIYAEKSDNRFIGPFSLMYDPMERLALFNFENDPDSVYWSFEMQAFDDKINGKGFLVIGYRNDRKVDVFYQPGVKIRTDYTITQEGLNEKAEREMNGARFDISDDQAVIDFAFADITGRPVEVHFHEDYTRNPRQSFDLLAPLGSDSKNPQTLPVFVMYDFSMAQQKNTDISIKVDGRQIQPDLLPIPFNGGKVYISRFSADPEIIRWNQSHSGPVDAIQLDGKQEVTMDGCQYTLVNHNGHPEIASIRSENSSKNVHIDFYPPFPELLSLKEGKTITGSFTAWLQPDTGQIDGAYLVSRTGSQVQIQIEPSGWRSGSLNPWAHLLFLAKPMFENWPSTYVWTADLDLSHPEASQMKSNWQRINQ